MKHIILLFAFTFFNVSYAQKSIKVSYEQRILYSDSFFNQLPEQDREEFRVVLSKPNRFELTNNGDFSLFKSLDLKEEVIASKEVNTATSINKGTSIKPFKVWVLKDFTKQSNVSCTEVEDKEYYVEKPFSVEELKYDKKVKVIDGYTCMSAFSVSSTNDTIQYWYTQEIPVIDGPFIMNTIPGLILSIESKKKLVYVTKIEFFDKKLEIETINKKVSFVIEADLVKLKNEALKSKSYTEENGGKHSTHSIQIKN
jgi:GLPGLI family protein